MRLLPASAVTGLCLLLAPGCTKQDAPPAPAGTELVSRIQGALADRERKVVSYRFDGVTVQGEDKAEFSFAWRAPGKMRGEYKSAGKTFAFDGKRFQQWDEKTRVLSVLELEKAPKEKAALLLHRVFAPFAPEGWRTPMLAGKLHAENKGEHVVLSAEAEAAGEKAVVEFGFAPPAMDFVFKSFRGGGETRVTAKHCEPALGLCFPIALEEKASGAPVATTTLSNIQINGAIPPETFELTAPEGAKTEELALE